MSIVPKLGKIVEAILKSDKLTQENMAALAEKFMMAASSCVNEGWNITSESSLHPLAGQCSQIIDICRQ